MSFALNFALDIPPKNVLNCDPNSGLTYVLINHPTNVMLRVHSRAARSYQQHGMLGEPALMALSSKAYLQLKDTNWGFLDYQPL